MSILVKEINSENFDEITSEGVILVDFWAPWCAPCKMQVHVLEEVALSVNGKAKIAKFNIDQDSKIGIKFGIQAIPTLILFKNGKEMQRFIGLQSDKPLIDGILALN